MSRAAEILKKLYQSGKVTLGGLKMAVADGVITEDEYLKIMGEAEAWDLEA